MPNSACFFMFLSTVIMFLSTAIFFKINCFEKLSEGQTVLVQIRPDVLLSLIWVQTAFKGYQRTTLVGKEVTRKSGFFSLDC